MSVFGGPFDNPFLAVLTAADVEMLERLAVRAKYDEDYDPTDDEDDE